MVFRYLLVFLLAFTSVAHATSADCDAALKTLFANEVSKEEAGEFLKVQGDLTLHRMAWAYLKAQKDDQTEKLENVESTILTLLDEKYTSTDPAFINAREAFESQPLSRTTLAEIAPYLKEVLSKEHKREDDAFILNASDLKLLHALSKFEKAKAVNGKFESRMLARHSPEGMLNFMKLINSSYRTGISANEDALQVEVRLQGIEKTLASMQKRVNDFLSQLQTPTQCQEDGVCELPDFADFFNQHENIQSIFWESLSDKLESDDLLLDNLTYGELWLQTHGHQGTHAAPTKSPAVIQVRQTTDDDEKPHRSGGETPTGGAGGGGDYAPPKPKKTTGGGKSSSTPNRTVVGTKTKYSEPSSVRGYYASSTGLYIEDPIAVIVKDKPGRNHKSWEGFGKAYLEKFSDAILNDDKVFEDNGNVYDRTTGRALSVDQVLAKFPPKKREEMRKLLTSKDPKFKSKQLTAMVNGDSTFIYNGQVYSIRGGLQSPALTISVEMTKKTGKKHEPNRYKGMDHGYLVERANALSNNKPHFKYKNEVFDSETGRSITSPFRSTASTQNMNVNKQKRIQYQNLSDKEVIINFHRDRPNKNGCQHYAIIDKLKAEISVYDLAGNRVFHTETLVGNVRSDQKTYWTKYEERDKMTNRSTGAGIYTVNQPKLNNDYYKRNYSNNILQLSDQNGVDQVFAVHQVPNGMPERNKLFGANPEKRWVSSGCANLKLEDYKKLTKWIKPTCQIYVLPEEAQNHFVVKDNKLQMVADRYGANRDRYNYNTKNTYLPMDIRITDPNGKTPSSEKFVQALEDEKQTLMGVFNLSNEEYNDLASLAYGIMGNESNFGKSKKYWYKENFQGDVIIAKAAKRAWEGKNPFSSATTNTSRGYTQIKEFPEGAWHKLEKYKHINKENLGDPKNSAITTMAYLVDAVTQLKQVARKNAGDSRKVRITKENLVDYLGYIYQGRRGALMDPNEPANADFSTYVQGLRKNMSYLQISQRIE